MLNLRKLMTGLLFLCPVLANGAIHENIETQLEVAAKNKKAKKYDLNDFEGRWVIIGESVGGLAGTGGASPAGGNGVSYGSLGLMEFDKNGEGVQVAGSATVFKGNGVLTNYDTSNFTGSISLVDEKSGELQVELQTVDSNQVPVTIVYQGIPSVGGNNQVDRISLLPISVTAPVGETLPPVNFLPMVTLIRQGFIVKGQPQGQPPRPTPN